MSQTRLQAYRASCNAQSHKDFFQDDEFLSGQYAISVDLQNLIAKYFELLADIKKESAAKYRDDKVIARLHKIAGRIRDTLASKGINVDDPSVQKNCKRIKILNVKGMHR